MTIEKFLFLQERGNSTVLDKVGAGQRLLHGFARGDSRSSRWVEFRNIFASNRLICIACCFRHAIRAWNLFAWNPCSRDVPIQPTQSQIPDKNLASEHLVGDWGNLLGHLEGQLGGRDDPSNGSALVAGTLSLARARRSARRRRRHAIQRQLWDVLPHSEALDKQLRKRYHKTNKMSQFLLTPGFYFKVLTNSQTSTPKSSVSKTWAWASTTPEPHWVVTTGILIAQQSKSLARPVNLLLYFCNKSPLSSDNLSSLKYFLLRARRQFLGAMLAHQVCYLVFSSRLKSICQ